MDEGLTRPARHRPAPVLQPATPSSSSSTSKAAMAVYSDPAVQDLCRLETFQDDFSSRDFLAGLSHKLIARSRADPGPFNPRPFIRTFEAAIESLQGIRRNLQEDQAALTSSVQIAHSAYSSKLHELSSHFTSVSQSFSSLESRFSEVSRTAIHIGEQLESVDRQRSRAVEAHDLIEYYYAFAREDTSKLDSLRKDGGREGRLKTAIIARRLAAISREVDVPGAEKTRETVDRYNERFERDMLKLFDRFYRKSDPRMMSHIAQVLQNFNGGQSCVQIYVNQHDFFISKDRVGEANRMESSEIWQTLADPDALPPQSEHSLASLFDEIRITVEQEAQIISAVFPNPLMVMSTFLQRVFAQSVQGYVEVLMTKAAEVGAAGVKNSSSVDSSASLSELTFLRVLQMARSMSMALIADLKMYDFRGPGGGPSRAEVPHRLGFMNEDEGGHSIGPHGAAANPLSFMLESAVEEIFVPYMEGTKYLEKESKSLTELYALCLSRFAQYHRSPVAGTKLKTTGLFDRVRAAAGGANSPAPGTSGASASGSAPPLLSPTGAAPQPTKTSAFSKLSGFVDRARGATPLSINPAIAHEDTTSADSGTVQDGPTPLTSIEQVEENDGELSLTVAERMLRWHAEAVGRCVDLSNPSDVGKNIFALLKTLVDALLKSYLEVAIVTASFQVATQDVKGSALPDLSSFFRVVRQVELITSLWQHYVSVAIIPLTGGSVTLRREVAIFNNHNLLRVEGKCDALVQKLVDNVVNYLTNRLATQKRNDYAPKNDELAFSRMNTDPCIACSEALERTAKFVRSSLGSGKNAESILLEIGVAFHSLLLDHFKKYTVSAAGGLMLTKDLAMYQDSIATFGSPVLNDRFEMLRSLGNLFIVQPSVLKGYMREGHLSKIDERLLHAFLLRRSDYAKEVRGLEDATHVGRGNGNGSGGGAGGGNHNYNGSIPSGMGISHPRVSQDSTTVEIFNHNNNGDTMTSGGVGGGGGGGRGRLSLMLQDLERYAAGHATSSRAGTAPGTGTGTGTGMGEGDAL